MIDLTKIEHKITEEINPITKAPQKRIVSRLQIHAGSTVDNSEPEAEHDAAIAYNMRCNARTIFDMTYGELQSPVRKLMMCARKNATAGDEQYVRDLCNEIEKLLAPPIRRV